MANTLTWVGGIDGNDAGSPLNWQPQLAPAAGDELSAPFGGTIDISGNVLQGDELDLGGGAESVSTTLNVSGNADFSLHDDVSDHTYINLADGSQWTGTLDAMPGSIQFINWPGTMVNDGTSSLWASTTTISANVSGNGSFLLTDQAFLQFQGAVSAGQTINLRGIGPAPGGTGDHLVTLSLASPSQFNGTINMAYGETMINGVKADSYSYEDNVLDLWSGNVIVDTLRLTNGPDAYGNVNPIEVYETPFSTNVENAPTTASSAGYYDGGSLLPEHVFWLVPPKLI